MSKRNTIKVIVLIVSLLVLAVVGSTMAYFTDGETADNTFEIGDVKLQINEPDYPQNKNDRILAANQKMPKNPSVENIGTNDEVVFLAITVPLEKVTMIDSGKQKDPDGQKYQEIFKFYSKAEDTSFVTDADKTFQNEDFYYNAEWVYLNMEEDADKHTRTYYFGWPKVLYVAEEAAEETLSTTSALFDGIQLKSFIEKEITVKAEEVIGVLAYGIQANGIPDYDLSEGTVSEAQLKDILQIYINQNGR